MQYAKALSLIAALCSGMLGSIIGAGLTIYGERSFQSRKAADDQAALIRSVCVEISSIMSAETTREAATHEYRLALKSPAAMDEKFYRWLPEWIPEQFPIYALGSIQLGTLQLKEASAVYAFYEAASELRRRVNHFMLPAIQQAKYPERKAAVEKYEAVLASMQSLGHSGRIALSCGSID